MERVGPALRPSNNSSRMVEKSQAHARPCLPKGLRLAAAEPLLSPTLPVGLRNLFHVLPCASVRANNVAYAKSYTLRERKPKEITVSRKQHDGRDVREAEASSSKLQMTPAP